MTRINMFVENGVIKTSELQFDENCGGLGKVLYESFNTYSDGIALVSVHKIFLI